MHIALDIIQNVAYSSVGFIAGFLTARARARRWK